jgi:hypothetical protein
MWTNKSSIIRPSYRQGFARSAGESANSNLWKSVIGLWSPFLGPTGKRLYDWSPFRNHGTISGANWVSEGLNFDGAADYVFAEDSRLHPTSPISISAWVMRTGAHDAGNGGGIAGSWFDSDGYLLWCFPGTNNFEFVIDAAGTRASSGITATLNTWFNVVGTWDGITGRIYVDGVFKDDQAEATLTPSGKDFEIGRYAGVVNTNWNGLIADVILDNRAWTAKEVWNLYQNPYALFQQYQPLPMVAIGGIMNQIQWQNLGNDLYDGTFLIGQ